MFSQTPLYPREKGNIRQTMMRKRFYPSATFSYFDYRNDFFILVVHIQIECYRGWALLRNSLELNLKPTI